MYFALSAALLLLALPLIRELTTAQGRFQTSGFDGVGVLISFVIAVCVATFTTPVFGIAFVFTLVFYEFSAAKACHIAGCDIARVRLAPVPFFAPPRSDTPFEKHLEESFVALYPAALAIFPMLTAFGIFHLTAASHPSIANTARQCAIMFGTLNFVLLLPFHPFAGGRVIRAISSALWPKMGMLLTLFMASAFLSAAYRDQSLAMFVLAAAGFQSAFHRPQTAQTRLSPNEALLVMACYAFMLTVHFIGGFWLLKGLI